MEKNNYPELENQSKVSTSRKWESEIHDSETVINLAMKKKKEEIKQIEEQQANIINMHLNFIHICRFEKIR